MKLRFIADVHISPLTVKELQKAGYAITRVTDHLPSTASDSEIILLASKEQAAGGLDGVAVEAFGRHLDQHSADYKKRYANAATSLSRR